MPYIEFHTDKGVKKFLVDTGSNLNFVNKEHAMPQNIQNCLTPKTFRAASGNVVKMNKYVFADPLETKCPSGDHKKFFLFNISKNFDGLLGYLYLQEAKAKIDTHKNLLILPNKTFRLKNDAINNRPKKSTRVHLEPLSTKVCKIATYAKDGDFLIENDRQIADNVNILGGLYRVENNMCYLMIANNNKFPITCQSENLNPNFNNFSIMEEKFLVENDDADILSKIRSDHLNKKEKEKLSEVILKFRNAFHKEGNKLTFTNIEKHKIETTDDVPVFSRQYRYPHAYKEEVKTQIEDLIRQNIIQPSKSPFNSPIFLVPKKQDASGKKKFRLVIDYRKLNKKTVDDKYPIPNITDILDKLGKCQLFSTLDLASGFHQVEIDEKDRKKTAFSTDGGHYEFVRMPFGLKNSPSTFQRVMNNVLGGLIGTTCLLYIDDIIIFSSSLQEHMEKLSAVLKRLQKFNFKIQLDKSEFLKKQVSFLGHIVTAEGIKPNPELISAIKKWPIPKDEKELRGFLGTIGYYRKFVKDLAKIAQPLTAALKKGEKIIHNKEFIESFEKCKQILTCSSILQYPDFEKPFILTTDASNGAIGAVLSQGNIGSDRPVAYASRTLQKSERNYSTIEKELLAIVWACKYFKPYLYGKKFSIYTDHKPLTYMASLNDANSRLVRWKLSLSEFDYDVIYKPGKQNVVADGLSRIQIDENPEDNKCLFGSSLENNADTSDLQTIHSAESDNTFLIPSTLQPINKFANQIILEIDDKNENNFQEIFPHIHRRIIKKSSYNENDFYNIFKDFLDPKKQNCLMMPENIMQMAQNIYRTHFVESPFKIFIAQRKLVDITSPIEQDKLIEKIHNRAHRGIDENIKQLENDFFFPRLKAKVRTFVNLCTNCKRQKYDRKPYKLEISKTPIPKRPLEIVHIDVYITKPDIFISMVDKHSRFGTLISIKSRTIPDMKKGLLKIFSLYGKPKLLVSDNESALKSIEIREMLQNLEINTYYTPSNRSEVNGIVERFHSTISEIFKCLRKKFSTLSQKELFRIAVSEYNQTIHAAHKLKPIEAFYGIRESETRQLNLEEIVRNSENFHETVTSSLKKKQEVDLSTHNKKKEPDPKFDIGEQVLVERQGIKSKTKNNFEIAVVKEDRIKTIIDEKNRKIHKANIKRKN